jgi:Protein of unknown function (DUF2975)
LENLFARFSKPQHLARLFGGLAILQLVYGFYEFAMTYLVSRHRSPAGLTWSQELNISPVLDYQRHWNRRFQFPESVEAYFHKGDLIFSFSSFSEMFNLYTVSFFIVFLLKWGISFYAFWQLSKIFNEKTDFSGFSTEGVKYMRKAALPILLIPFLNFFSKWIFIKYAATQSTWTMFSTHTIAYIIGDFGGNYVYHWYISLILLALAQVFQYATQLKEDAQLTI